MEDILVVEEDIMVENGWKRLKLVENGWKLLETVELTIMLHNPNNFWKVANPIPLDGSPYAHYIYCVWKEYQF